MNILMIALQGDTANGICAETITRECLRRGHQVQWVVNRGTCPSLNDDGATIYTVKPRLIDRILAWCSRSARKQSRFTQLIRMGAVWLNRVKMMIGIAWWPLVSPLYAHRVTKAAFAAFSQHKSDIVLGIYTQIDALIAANEIKKRYPSSVYIAYFLDSLSGGKGPKVMSSSQAKRQGRKWERRLLANCDAAIVMESSRPFHERNSSGEVFYNKLIYLDLPLLKMIETPRYEKTPGDFRRIVYAGSIPTGIRSPDFILEAMSRIVDTSLRLEFIGDCESPALQTAAEFDSRIVLRGRVSHDEAIAAMQGANCLLSLGNNLPHMAPSKVFEYMALQKPIIATYPIDDEPSLTYLKKYGHALLLDERRRDYDTVAQEVLNFLDSTSFVAQEGRIEELRCIFKKNTPEYFCDVIEQIAKKLGVTV